MCAGEATHLLAVAMSVLVLMGLVTAIAAVTVSVVIILLFDLVKSRSNKAMVADLLRRSLVTAVSVRVRVEGEHADEVYA